MERMPHPEPAHLTLARLEQQLIDLQQRLAQAPQPQNPGEYSLWGVLDRKIAVTELKITTLKSFHPELANLDTPESQS